MYVRIYVTLIMVDHCNQRSAVYQPFSHSRFLQVALSFYPETSSLSYTFSTTFMRPLRELCLPPISPIFSSPCPSPSLLVSRFSSYVYFILRFLHPLAATPESPSPSTSTNILIIPWKPPQLRVLTRSWKTRPSEPPRGSVLSLPCRASLNFALGALLSFPLQGPFLFALAFVTMESIRTLEAAW